MDPKSKKCVFLGYVDGVKEYHSWDPTAHKAIISRVVIFAEDKLQIKEGDSTVKENLETTSIQVENNPEHEDVNSSEAAPEHEEQEPIEAEAPKVYRSIHVRRPPAWHSDYITKSNIAYCLLTKDREPSTFHEATKSLNVSIWMTAMQEELKALHKNKT